MDNKMNEQKLNDEVLKNVNGGTHIQTALLFTYLNSAGLGDGLLNGLDVDLDAMKRLFAEHGYTFKPSEKGQNLFEKDGLVYSQDYIENLIKKREF